MRRKDYPVYGRTIAAHIARGEKPIAVGVLLSARWWSSFDHVARVCINPDDWAPRSFEFGYLQGMHVVAVAGDCEEQQFGELVLDLMCASPALLWAFDVTGRELSADKVPDPTALAQWAAKMAGDSPATHKAFVQIAIDLYNKGIERAATRELEEIQKITARRGAEAAGLWCAKVYSYPDRVREQFSLKSLEPGVPSPV